MANYVPIIVSASVDAEVPYMTSTAVVSRDEIMHGIEFLMISIPREPRCTYNIHIGPEYDAADALVYNEQYEKRQKNAIVVRPDDYEEKRKKAFKNKKKRA